MHRYWNWKTALLSTLLRAPIWIASELRAGARAAVTAGLVDATFRLVIAGLTGALLQRLRRVQPDWLASVIAMFGIPAAVHSIEAVVHWSRGTPHWTIGLQVSVLVSIMTTLFNLYAMRKGALLAGELGQPFIDDLRRLPRLFVHFLRHPFCWLVGCVVVMAVTAHAADLQPRTSRAYDEYAERARRTFVERASRASDAMDASAPIAAGPGHEDGIVGVAGGLIHHWKGSAFLRGATLRHVMETTQDYSSYPKVYRAVTSARVLQQGDDTARVLMRLHESAGGLSAVLEVRSTIHHVYPAAGRAYSIATLDEVREVENPGTRSERLLPPGRDRGYLWRGATFTLFVEHDGGVYVEMETLGLSRSFPPMLRWIIEPIARRLGRRSVETSLREFQAAVLKHLISSSFASARLDRVLGFQYR